MTAAEIDEGALEKAFKQTLERFFITLPPQLHDEVFQAFLAALPAPASGGAEWDRLWSIASEAVLYIDIKHEIREQLKQAVAATVRAALPAPASGGAVLSCPFCGSNHVTYERLVRSMRCRNPDCCAQGPKGDDEGALWNRRAALPAPASGGAVAWLRENIASGAKELSFEPLADMPFNRERWRETPLYPSPASGGAAPEGRH